VPIIIYIRLSQLLLLKKTFKNWKSFWLIVFSVLNTILNGNEIVVSAECLMPISRSYKKIVEDYFKNGAFR